jgi:hypothetical protein
MYQADVNAQSMRTSVRYSRLRWFIILSFIGLILYGLWWGLSEPKRRQQTLQPRFNVVAPAQPAPVVQAPQQQPVVQQSRVTTQMIEDTLWIVARYIDGGRDMTGNGKSNCEDAAILFYMYFPLKENVMIYANDNPNTGMSHAFNLVFIDGNWRAVEPMAYRAGFGWAERRTFFMRDIWGSVYDPAFNFNAWSDYGRFVR